MRRDVLSFFGMIWHYVATYGPHEENTVYWEWMMPAFWGVGMQAVPM